MMKPKLRFNQFKDDWQKWILSEISSIRTGPFGSVLHEEDYVEVGTPIITVEHLGEQGVVHKNLPLVSDEDKLRLKNYTLKSGDIVFSRVGSVDRSCLISNSESGWLFSGRLLRVRLTKDHSPEFLNQNFKCHKNKHRIRSVAVGQTMASLNTEILNKFSLNFPPTLEEQKKIASFLAKVDKKISLLSKKHELLLQYKKGVMQKIFNQEIRFKDEGGGDFPAWENKEIGELFQDFKGTGLSKDEVTNDGINKCILYGELFTKYSEIISDVISRTNSMSTVVSRKGDLLMPSSTTTSALDLAIASAIMEDGVFLGGDIIVLRPKSNLNSQYFAYYLTHGVKSELAKNAQGITIIHMYFNKIKSVVLSFPCIHEQQLISNFLFNLDKKINLVKTQIELTKQYKQGLLQQMFI